MSVRRYFYPGCLMVEVEAVKVHAWLRNGGPTLDGLPGEVHFALAVLCLLIRWCEDEDPSLWWDRVVRSC